MVREEEREKGKRGDEEPNLEAGGLESTQEPRGYIPKMAELYRNLKLGEGRPRPCVGEV